LVEVAGAALVVAADLATLGAASKASTGRLVAAAWVLLPPLLSLLLVCAMPEVEVLRAAITVTAMLYPTKRTTRTGDTRAPASVRAAAASQAGSAGSDLTAIRPATRSRGCAAEARVATQSLLLTSNLGARKGCRKASKLDALLQNRFEGHWGEAKPASAWCIADNAPVLRRSVRKT
jgi:hypothetical protein